MKTVCEIYRGSRREEMYLYIDKSRGLDEVPKVLLDQFGDLSLVMTLLLLPDRKLARVDVGDVLAAIHEQGFYLQMPPSAAELASRGSKDG